MPAIKYVYSVLLALLLGAGVSTVSHAIEEPEYTVLAQLGELEIRQYEPTIQAVTPLSDHRAMNSGFRRLAGYIFGGNAAETEIAMTAPVATSMGAAEPEMAFTMPSQWRLDELPAPDSDAVELREVPGFTAAVVRFSGWATKGRASKHERLLAELIDEEGLQVVSPPVLNQYNPPWTPPWKRRNEVMVEVRDRGHAIMATSF